MKLEKIKNALEEAEVKSKLSPDSQTKVGAVLIDSFGDTILSSYNGFIRQAPDHKLPNTRPDKYRLILHAEHNILLQAARRGISVGNCIVVTTHSPCEACVRACWQAGIEILYFKNIHSSFADTLNMQDLKTELEYLDDCYKLTLSQKE